MTFRLSRRAVEDVIEIYLVGVAEKDDVLILRVRHGREDWSADPLG